jgi:hypothetical protein
MRVKSMGNGPALTRIKAGSGRQPGNWPYANSMVHSMPGPNHTEAPPLDFRELVAPMPLMRSMDAANLLQPGDSQAVLTPLWPLPLFSALSDAGFEWKASHLPCGGARVEIRRPDVAP